jgi:hypothetical protein
MAAKAKAATRCGIESSGVSLFLEQAYAAEMAGNKRYRRNSGALLARLILPVGQITCAIYRPPCQSPFAKIFCFSETQITAIFVAVLSHRGALANVTNAGQDAVDAGGASDEGVFPADGEAVWS